MVRIVSAISEVLALPVMAEGVENAEQRDCLLQHGIRSGQGFLFARPLPRAAFEAEVLPRGAVSAALPFRYFSPSENRYFSSTSFALVQTKHYAIFSFAPRLTRFSS